ncbi:MAG TPA: hypothetical protein O0X27_04595 [Methanocorpusculum sp.]|nr:hypothetical protein [Methanocorpusculum sp.]
MIQDHIEHHTHHGLMPALAAVSVLLLLAVCAGSAAADYNVAYGDTVNLVVDNPFGGTAYFYIQGTNFPFSPLKDASGNQLTVSGRGTRSVELNTADIRSKTGQRPDTGTYTIYVSNNPSATGPGNLDSGNGYWRSYALTLRPIGVSVTQVSSVSAVAATPVPTAVSAFAVPAIPATPASTPTPTPASPGPLAGLIAGLCAAVLALRR